METTRFIEWLKDRQLFHVARNKYSVFQKVLTGCLGLRREKLLIIGDMGYANKRISPLMTACYYLAAKELKMDAEVAIQNPKKSGEAADDFIADALFRLEPCNAVVVCASEKIGNLKQIGKSFRSFCKKNDHRFVSTVSLGYLDTKKIDSIISAIDIDYAKQKEKDDNIMRILEQGKKLKVRTDKGTDLTMDIGGVPVSSADGDYRQPGTGGNIPAGEVYLPPRKVNGTVMVDASSRSGFGTKLPKEPIMIKIKDSRITDIEGGIEAGYLRRSFEFAEARAKYPERVRIIGEMGIGLNQKARIIGSTIVDEKVINTAHIAVGSNYWFGGDVRTIIHYDQIFNNPRLYVDGKELKINAHGWGSIE
ncbi:hypothetical protein GF351_05095 [Candidatus Woesearchaeota archaeon]|nr:hypothetical protein [Candidatus Woesearchaeota archaeon]